MSELANSQRGPRAILAGLLALAAWFAFDALLFRTSLYPAWIQPDSTCGRFELTLRRELDFQQRAGDNVVVTIGNSRFAYLPRQANELSSRSGYIFRSAGVAGTDPRTWYYMLRDLDPTAQRYRAVVVGVDHFYDEEQGLHSDDDLCALRYAIARLRFSDIVPFVSSFRSWPVRWEAFRGALFKGFVFQRDIHEFLNNPRKRIEYVKLSRGGFEEWTYNYIEQPQSLAGLTIDWSTMTANFPPNLEPKQIETVRNQLLAPVAPQTGRLAAYRRLWFGRIAGRYRNSRTKVIFLALSRGPIPRPDELAQKQSSVVAELAAVQTNVLLTNEHAFDSLDHPELYQDGVHLNREGATRFASLLVAEICRLLGTPLPSN